MQPLSKSGVHILFAPEVALWVIYTKDFSPGINGRQNSKMVPKISHPTQYIWLHNPQNYELNDIITLVTLLFGGKGKCEL